jgi:hypothetical protein
MVRGAGPRSRPSMRTPRARRPLHLRAQIDHIPPRFIARDEDEVCRVRSNGGSWMVKIRSSPLLP